MAETIGQRIKKARLEAGLTQPDLAKKCGWDSQGRISNYERDLREPKRHDLEVIAKALNVSINWLWTGASGAEEGFAAHTANPSKVSVPPTTRHVPELNWEQAAMWVGAHDLNVNTSTAKYWACPVPCGEHTFALRVKSDAMAPHYPQGLLIYVDPDVDPVSGKKVVAAHRGATEAVFRQYIEDGGREILKAMNTNWPDPYLSIGDDCRIVGTVIFSGAEE